MTTTALKPFREITTDGELRVNLHRGQERVWNSDARFVVFQASTQGGKTCLGPHWLHREMASRGPGDYLAVTATFPLLRLKMLPELQLLFCSLLKMFDWKAGEKVFESHETIHGAPAYRIIVGSASNPESLESATAKAAWLDEAGQHQFVRQAWEAIQRRLSLSQGRVLFTTTPYEFNWFKTEVYDRWAAGDSDYDVIISDSLDNPAFPREEYERAQATLPRWKFNLFYKAQFEKPAGLIYDAFDEDTCLIPRFSIPTEWPHYVGHDFGPNNTAAVWFAQDPGTGYLYAHREYLDGGKSNYDHAQEFKSLSGNELIIKRCGGSNTEDDSRESYRAAGWPISKPRIKEVEAGINAVYGWVAQNKLFVFTDMYRFLDELLTYSRELDENYQPTEKIAAKSTFHLMDSMRYILSDFGPERAAIRTQAIQKRWGHQNPNSIPKNRIDQVIEHRRTPQVRHH